MGYYPITKISLGINYFLELSSYHCSWLKPRVITYYLHYTDQYELKFLFHLFKYMKFEKLDSSTAIPSLRRDDVFAQTIPLPPH